MPTVGEIAAFMGQYAPLSLAAEWDNVGLLLGDESSPVEKLMTCLTVTPESAAEAVESGAAMIVSHHPIFFRPVKKLTASGESTFLWRLASNGVAVYSAHTAFDDARGGINDLLARRLGLTDVKPLRPAGTAREAKIVVFLPESDFEPVSSALFAAGAGQIGEYSECSHRVIGTGTFFGSEETSPTIGKKGQREEATEWRMEVICSFDRIPQALEALRQAHSYEEPAYDVYALEAKPSGAGHGRIGHLSKTMTLQQLAGLAKTTLKASFVHLVGKKGRRVRTVAVACGAGGEFLGDAVRADADVFLTGEMRFHDLLRAQAEDIALLLPGHFATERHGAEELASVLQRQWPNVEVWASRQEKDPLSNLM